MSNNTNLIIKRTLELQAKGLSEEAAIRQAIEETLPGKDCWNHKYNEYEVWKKENPDKSKVKFRRGGDSKWH